MNEEIHTVLIKKKGKTATNEWENDGSDIYWSFIHCI